jgi:hypothetical protein
MLLTSLLGTSQASLRKTMVEKGRPMYFPLPLWEKYGRTKKPGFRQACYFTG